MGVVILQHYPIPEGKSGIQVLDALQKRLESLGAVKSGSFCVDCETYYSIATVVPQRAIHIVRNSEQPATCFALTDTGYSLIADLLFDALMNKLSTIYTPKKSIKIESKGQRYVLCDFVVKTGSVSVGPSFKGILIEIEYLPCSIPSNCFELMKEFLNGVLNKPQTSVPTYLQTRMDQVYTAMDTVHQYMEHFNNFRKATVASR